MAKSVLAMIVLPVALVGGVAGVRADEANKTSTDAGLTSLYVVKDGNKVDSKTLEGWKTWRALACERCHGAEQEGLSAMVQKNWEGLYAYLKGRSDGKIRPGHLYPLDSQ